MGMFEDIKEYNEFLEDKLNLLMGGIEKMLNDETNSENQQYLANVIAVYTPLQWITLAHCIFYCNESVFEGSYNRIDTHETFETLANIPFFASKRLIAYLDCSSIQYDELIDSIKQRNFESFKRNFQDLSLPENFRRNIYGYYCFKNEWNTLYSMLDNRYVESNELNEILDVLHYQDYEIAASFGQREDEVEAFNNELKMYTANLSVLHPENFGKVLMGTFIGAGVQNYSPKEYELIHKVFKHNSGSFTGEFAVAALHEAYECHIHWENEDPTNEKHSHKFLEYYPGIDEISITDEYLTDLFKKEYPEAYILVEQNDKDSKVNDSETVPSSEIVENELEKDSRIDYHKLAEEAGLRNIFQRETDINKIGIWIKNNLDLINKNWDWFGIYYVLWHTKELKDNSPAKFKKLMEIWYGELSTVKLPDLQRAQPMLSFDVEEDEKKWNERADRRCNKQNFGSTPRKQAFDSTLRFYKKYKEEFK